MVPLQEAATRLGKDPRTVIRAITAGEIRGGAMPRPERLRWYVYADALPGATPTAAPPGRRCGGRRPSRPDRLAVGGQPAADRGPAGALDADRATNDAAEKYRAVARNYLDALGQFMTPGHLGDLADL